MSMDLADAIAAYTAGVDALLAADLDTPPLRELVDGYADIETQNRRVPSVQYAMLARLEREADPRQLGATSLWKLISRRARLNKGDTQRRIRWSKTLAPRRTFQGQQLAPVWEHTAAAIAAGAIGADHVTVIDATLKILGRHLDDTTWSQAEQTLADVAPDLTPKQLQTAANHLLALLHPDGELADGDADRKIGLSLGPQQPDGTSYLKGWISPTLRALLEPVIAKFAHRNRRTHPAPPAQNPNPFAEDAPPPEDDWPTLVDDDPADDAADDADQDATGTPDGRATPDGSGAPPADTPAPPADTPAPPVSEPPADTPAPPVSEPPADTPAPPVSAPPADTTEPPAPGPFAPHPDDPAPPPREPLIDHKLRSKARFTHDAIAAGLEMLLRAKTLGTLNGLPTTIVVTTTLTELSRGAGYAVTAGGTRIPIAHLIALAAKGAYHYLEVFDDHTGEILHLGRAKRCATGPQKLALFGRDRGCTAPGCDVAAYDCQAHHAVADWKHNGRTDVDDLTLACGPDNQLIDDTDWNTARRPDGRFEWIPPRHLDHGQPRTNNTHHPERLLHPPRSDHPPDDDPL